MSPEVLTYPFIFLAIFFESFLLVTFLSKPARISRLPRKKKGMNPRVAIIVPVWNEESTIAGTVESLLALDYPHDKLSIILVDDGSTDTTPAVVDRFADHPQITALHKVNGGKFSAMNLGIAHAGDASLIGFLDADSFVAPDALREITTAFSEPHIMAVIASMAIHNPQTLIQRMQHAEYALSIFLRHVLGSLNALYVTPGPFSFYRRDVFTTLGMFKHAYQAEDMEMALRIQRAGFQIGNALSARVYTKGPPTVAKLLKQRVRWTTGFLRNILFEYRDLLGNKQNPALGWLVLPLAVLSIPGCIVIFCMGMAQLLISTWHTFSVVQVVPLSYTFTPHPFAWYQISVTAMSLLTFALLAATGISMVAGKQLSRTSGKLTFNMVAYMSLFWLLTPIWLLRSVTNVVRGTHTPWR